MIKGDTAKKCGKDEKATSAAKYSKKNRTEETKKVGRSICTGKIYISGRSNERLSNQMPKEEEVALDSERVQE